MASSNWADSTTALAGKPAKKPKKVVKEIRTRKGKSGGYIHEHHHTAPDAHPMEEHTSADQDAMLQHMMSNMGSGGGAAPNPGGDDEAAAAAPPGAGAAQAPPPAIPGT